MGLKNKIDFKNTLKSMKCVWELGKDGDYFSYLKIFKGFEFQTIVKWKFVNNG